MDMLLVSILSVCTFLSLAKHIQQTAALLDIIHGGQTSYTRLNPLLISHHLLLHFTLHDPIRVRRLGIDWVMRPRGAILSFHEPNLM